MASSVSGRRIGDITAITLVTLFVCIPLAALAGNGAGLFSVTQSSLRIGFLVPSIIGIVLLSIGSIFGLYLIWHSDRSGGSLGVPDWPELSAASCAISMVGFIMQTSAFIVLIPTAILGHINHAFLYLIFLSTAFLAIATLYAGFHTILAFRDNDGDDVIEFENTNIKKRQQQVLDKEDKYWSTADDEDEVEDAGKGLQY